jgi:hypothetical protein
MLAFIRLGGVFGHIVLAKHQYHSHGNNAERRQQQQAAGIAAGMVLDPAHRKRPCESRKVADRIIYGDSGRGRGAGLAMNQGLGLSQTAFVSAPASFSSRISGVFVHELGHAKKSRHATD